MRRQAITALVLVAALQFDCTLRAFEPAPPAAGGESAQQPAAKSGLPSAVDLRPQLLKFELGPRRQGRRNTCSVFTTVAAIEFAVSKTDEKGVRLSVEYLNWACNQTIGNRTEDRGQFFRDLLKAYDRYGLCPEAEMPYRRRFDPELGPSDQAKQQADAIRKQRLQIHWIRRWNKESGLTDEQLREVERVLADGFPVAAGASHSRLLVGYRRDANQPGGGVFLTKDSGSGQFDEVSYEFAKTEINDVFWVEPPAGKPPK